MKLDLDWPLIVYCMDLPFEANELASCCSIDVVEDGRILLSLGDEDAVLYTTDRHHRIARGFRDFLGPGPSIALTIEIVKG
jgi:hypothetical protein